MLKQLHLFVLIMLSITAFAEKKNNFYLFKDASVVNYSIDFTLFKVNNVPAKNYLEMKYNLDYDKFKQNFEDIFISSAKSSFESHPIMLTNDQPSDFELTLTPVSADRDGEHTILCRLQHKPSGTIVSLFKINTNGGDNDAFLEEIMLRIAKSGMKLSKELEKIKKKANAVK